LNELQNFKNEMFEVSAKLNDGEVLFDAEKVAKNLGFTEIKNGVEYVRWRTVNSYLKFSQDVAKGDLIPEALVYKLAFKASNETAEKFQDWLAIEVIPSIRKTGTYKVPLSKKEEMKLYLEALEEQDAKIEAVNKDLQDFKLDIPLLGVECDKITNAVKKIGVNCLGGKNSKAYKNKSLRGKVYSDIHGQLKREFAVTTYKAIKRSQVDIAIEIVNGYKTPFALNSEIHQCNSQIDIDEQIA